MGFSSPKTAAQPPAPVVLDYDYYDRLHDPSTLDIADPTELLTPYPAEELVVYPVSQKVNRADADEPRLLEAVSGARACSAISGQP